jgi:diguanylate cyclase (GGDEF)-like protein/PAS domain S-box-containing protein
MRKWSLSVAIPARVGLLLLIVLSVMVGVNYKFSQREMVERARADILNQGYLIQPLVIDALAQDPLSIQPQSTLSAELAHQALQVSVIDSHGTLLFSTSAAPGLEAKQFMALDPLSYHQASEQGKLITTYDDRTLQLELYMPLVESNSQVGANNSSAYSVLLILNDLKPEHATLIHTLLMEQLPLVSVAVLVLLLVALMLRRSIVKPLTELTSATQQIDQLELDNLSIQGLGEIGAMEQAIVSMGRSVQHTLADLKASEQRWQFALTGSGDGVWDWDLVTNRICYSKQWAAMLGYKEEEIGDTIGEWDSRVHPDDIKIALKGRQACLMDQEDGREDIHRLKTKSGSYIWVLVRRMVVERGDDGKPSRLIGSQTNISDMRAAQELIKYQSSFDDVTRLVNRRKLLKKLELEIERSRIGSSHGALIYLDIDYFKNVNDMLGHAAGDLLLRLVAHRLSDGRLRQETVARLGGDEFALLLPDLADNRTDAAKKALAIADNIRLRMTKPFTIKGNEIDLTLTTGIALFPNTDSNSTEILRQADIALYQGKDVGRSGIYFFSDEMAEKVQERHHLQQQLRNAINNESMTLYYQPRYNANYEMVGAETLLRWFDNESGWISPGRFIPLAEESGLIVPLGTWVMRGACRALKLWQDKGCPSNFKTLSVNVSPKQFHRSKFVQETLAIIQEEGCDPNLLELEITEGMLVDNVEATIEKIKQLRAIGVRFSVDDFGTGYSSLAYLNKLPINCLKIDKSFINEVQNGGSECAIISTIIAMAKNLGLEVIAEGVETEYQLAFLKYRGCLVYQGFYFSEALEPELLEERLFIRDVAS